MADSDAVLAAKRRLSSSLLAVAGVSGVGVSQGRLRIYLDRDTAEVRSEVSRLLARHAAAVPYEIEVSGPFKAR